jgi:hypothetical protein
MGIAVLTIAGNKLVGLTEGAPVIRSMMALLTDV